MDWLGVVVDVEYVEEVGVVHLSNDLDVAESSAKFSPELKSALQPAEDPNP